jgi:thymidylate kinase
MSLAEMYSTTRPEVWGPVRDVLKKIRANQPVSTLELQLLFMADRFWHSLALPVNLELGTTVVCARYELSTFAYGTSYGVDLGELLALQDKVLCNRYVEPDIVIYVRVSARTAAERLEASGKIKDINETEIKIAKAYSAYDRVIDFGREHKRFGKIVEIDGEPSVEKVYASILAELRKSFGGDFKKLR